MRELLFRGKRVDNGKWVYGIPARFRKIDNVVRVTMIPELDGEHVMSECVCVDPDTVGQYTGQKDKYGVRIFEGDIIEFHQAEFMKYSEAILRGAVAYLGGTFYVLVRPYNGNEYTLEYVKGHGAFSDVRIIGNTSDNLSLLTGA